MKIPVALLSLLVLGTAASGQLPSPGVEHMRYARPVTLTTPGHQHFLRVDEETWTRSRRDLADLRLQDLAGGAVPYALRAQQEIQAAEELRADVFQPGRTGAATRFWIRIPDSIEEYDRVRLAIAAENFVAIARVEGAHQHAETEWTHLGESTLFDFTRERLGSSTALQLPPTRFRFLRVTVPSGVRPDQVGGAFVSSTVRQDARWMALSAAVDRQEDAGRTVFRWPSGGHIPLERIRIHVDSEERNFIRRVEISADGRVVASGHVRRIDMLRGGRTVRHEELDLPIAGVPAAEFEAVIHNGDDRPLRGARVVPFALERRLYFEPLEASGLLLFFGDSEARPPLYDYARLFREHGEAREAALGMIVENPSYQPRPDTRPWTERHPVVLWGAIVAAVVALGGLAVRSLRSA